MHRNHRGLIAGLLLLAQVVTGCSSWRVQSVTPQELFAREHPTTIKVWERGGATYEIEAPQVAGDSLIGSEEVTQLQIGGRFRVRLDRRIALATVDRIAVPRFNLAKTFALSVVGLVGVGSVVAYFMVKNILRY